MTRSLYGSLGLVAAIASSLACGPRDAKSVLEGAASALGASDLSSIQREKLFALISSGRSLSASRAIARSSV